MSSGFNFFADEVAYRAQTGRQAAASLGRRAHVRGLGQGRGWGVGAWALGAAAFRQP